MGSGEVFDSISSLGKLIIFALILPGLLGYGLTIFLFNKLGAFSDSATYAVSMIFFIGFISNFFGHFFGIIERKISIKKNFPFEIYKLSYDLDASIANRMRNDVDYWFSYYCWYWNSAVAIFLILGGKLYYAVIKPEVYSFSQFELYIFSFSILTAILLIAIAHKLLKDIIDLMEYVSPLQDNGNMKNSS